MSEIAVSDTLAVTRVNLLRWLHLLSRLAIGMIFLWSSLQKIRLPYQFLEDVYAYEMVGAKTGLLLAIALPWIELGIAIALIGGIFVGGALLSGIVLFCIFIAAQWSAMTRGLSIGCACFSTGSSEQLVGPATLGRTGVFLAVSILSYSTQARMNSELRSPRTEKTIRATRQRSLRRHASAQSL